MEVSSVPSYIEEDDGRIEEKESRAESLEGSKRIYVKSEQQEVDQLYCIHTMLKYAWGNNFGAPVKDLLFSDSGVKVLDFGCGSAFWTLEMATEFPMARFYGVDSIPSFPDSVTPENVEFIVANILKDGLPFNDAEFDYVFCRNVIFTFQTPNFESVVMKELLRVVKPGGYIELVEGDLKGQDWCESLEFWNVKGLKPLLESINIDYDYLNRFKEFLIKTNQLKDIMELKIKIPFGKYNKLSEKELSFIGELSAEVSMSVMKTMAEKLMPFLKLSHEEYFNLVKEIEEDTKSKNNASYFWYRRFIAQKL